MKKNKESLIEYQLRLNKLLDGVKKAREKINTRDRFEISDGNLKILSSIPLMMQDKNYRQELRKLTLKFLYSQQDKK